MYKLREAFYQAMSMLLSSATKSQMADTVAEIDLASSDRCLESTPTNAEISALIGNNNVFLIVVIKKYA